MRMILYENETPREKLGSKNMFGTGLSRNWRMKS